MNVEKSKYIYGLDIVRGISAILIILYHYTTRYNESMYTAKEYITDWSVKVSWGSLAVCTFFLLSGYLSGIYKEGNTLEYLKKRFVRIWPTFIVCCTLTSVCMAMFYNQAFVGWKMTVYNFTMLPILIGGGQKVDGVYWTLQNEIIFYFVVAILYALTKSKKVKENFLITWLVIAILFHFVPMKGIIGSILNIFLMPKYIGVFILGICTREYVDKDVDKRNIILFILSMCTLTIWSNKLTIAFTIGSAVLIYILSMYNFKINENTIIVQFFCFIASISYPLYLCHQMIGYAIIYHLQIIGLESEWIIIIPIMITIILATIIHYVIEVPVSKKLLELI